MEQNILSISIDDYKAKIKELEESLKGLKSTSDEYVKTLEKIKEYQDKLNEAIGKSTSGVKELGEQLSKVKPLDVGKSTDSLKEFKKETDNMKVALIGLDQNSEEYAKLANEIRERQTKLNEVMAIGKKNVDATAGSYNELQQQVRELVKENKNLEGGLTDNAEQFQKNAQEINKLNDKLKEADAQMGYFQRNVGDYKNSFLKAFDEMKSGPLGIVKGLNTLGENIKGMIVKNGSLGASFKAVGTTIKTNVLGALNILVKHPIIATISLVGALIAGLISKINMSAKATKSWERAMSAFQPVLNLVQRAIGFLVEKFADCADWLAKRLPNAIRSVTKAFSGGLRGVASFVEGFTKMPSVFKQVFSTIQKISTSGISLILKGIETLANALGMDGIAKKVRSAFDFLNKMSFDDQIKSISNGINSLADTIDKVGNAIADVQDEAYQRTVRQQQLNKDIANQTMKNLQDEKKELELRDKIATSTGKERLKYLKQLRQQIIENGKEEVALARRQLALAKERAELSPNSKEDNARLRELEANVQQAENRYNQALVSVDKLTTKTETSIRNEAKATAKEKERLTEKEYKARVDYYNALITTDKMALSLAVKGSKEEYLLKKQLIEDEYKANLNKINQEITDEAEKLNKIKLLNEDKNVKLLKNDNDFWNRTQTQALSSLRTVVESLDKNSTEYSKARMVLAKKEVDFQIESWDRMFKQFATSTSKAVTDVWNNFAEASDISVETMKVKMQNLMTYLEQIKEDINQRGGDVGSIDILEFMGIDPKDEKNKKALNELFKANFDGLDYNAFAGLFIQQARKLGNVQREEFEKIYKSEEETFKNHIDEMYSNANYKKTLKYYEDVASLALKRYTDIEAIGKKETETVEQYNARKLQAEQEYYKALQDLSEHSKGGEKEFDTVREEEAVEHSNKMVEIAREMYAELLQIDEENESERLAIQQKYNKQIEAEEERHSKKMVKIDNQQAKKQKMTVNDWANVYSRASSSISSVLDNVASMKEAQLQQDVENGKKSEEQAKAEFETIKDFQIAAATIDMLGSLVSVNASIWSDKGIPSTYAKIALSALESAAIITSGMMNINQIKSTEFGGSSGASGSGAKTVNFSTVAVNPLLDENADMANIQNVNVVSDNRSGGDQRVYILQSDLEDSSKQVQTRIKQSTF